MMNQRAMTFFESTSTTDPTRTTNQFDGSLTKDATFYTSPIYIGDALGWLLQFSCTDDDAPEGDITVEVSCDEADGQNGSPEEPDAHLADWLQIAVYDPTLGDYVESVALVGDALVKGFEYNGSFARWVRLKWTRTAGSLTAKIKLQKKGVS